MLRTVTVTALSLALLVPVPALAQEASPSPSAVCPNVSYVASDGDREGPAGIPVTIEGGSDVQPAMTPDRWTLTRVSPGPAEVVDVVEASATFSFTVSVPETTTFRIDAVGPEGCSGASATFTRTVTGSASPTPSPSPTSCTSGGRVSLSGPSDASVVAGEVVTVTATFTGGLRSGHLVLKGYDWETPTTQGPLPLTRTTTSVQHADYYSGAVAEGETTTHTWSLSPTTSTRYLADFGYQTTCGLYADGRSAFNHVIDVAPRLTLTAVRNAPRDYTFSGVATTPGLVLNLYRVRADGARVLTSQTRAADDSTWTIHRRFLGSGRFGFIVLTGRTMANAPGASNLRDTVIH